MSSVIGVIQARMGSSRLPGKILAPLGRRPLLEVLVSRLRSSRVDEWWLATTSEPADDVTEAWGHALDLRVFRGESEDVLSRFTSILGARDAEWVVRVTADDPFADGRVVDCLIDAIDDLGKTHDRLEIARASGLPLGYAPQLARSDAVLRAARSIPADQPFHRAHVLSWIEPIAAVAAPGDWPARPDWRWTVDTIDDLAMARAAFELFGYDASTIAYPEMVALLDAHPEVARANAHVEQKPLAAG